MSYLTGGKALNAVNTSQGLGSQLWRALPYAVYLWFLVLAFPVTPDDGFITLRFAANLLSGAGPVFNPGERVEGYSSPLHLLVSTLLLGVFGANWVAIAAKSVGIALGGWILHEAKSLGIRVGLSEREGVFAQLLLALNFNFAISTVNVLETPYHAALLLLLASTVVREDDTRRGVASSLLVFAAGISRPEAVLLFPIFFLFRAHACIRGTLTRRSLLIWSAGFVIPFAAFLTWRWFYYGALVPNTYFAKAYSWRSAIIDGIRYLLRPLSARTSSVDWSYRALRTLTPYFFWLPALAGAWLMRGKRAVVALGLVVSLQVVFCLKAGGDWMEGWRFMIVVAPLLAILQAFGVRFLSELAVRLVSGARALPLAQVVGGAQLLVLFFWVVAFTFVPRRASWPALAFTTDAGALLAATGGVDGVERAWGTQQLIASKLVRDRLAPGSTFAYSEIGYAGFQNMDKRIVDMRGLTDREIARVKVFKSSVGVSDPEWYDPAGPVGSILKRRHMDAIVSFDDVPVALGTYTRVISTGGVQLYEPTGQ